MENDMEKKVEEYFKNPKRVKTAEPCDGYMLLLTFDNGEQKVYDMSDRLTGVFASLQDRKKFESVFVDEAGNVAWDLADPEDYQNSIRLDLCKDALYMDSVKRRL